MVVRLPSFERPPLGLPEFRGVFDLAERFAPPPIRLPSFARNFDFGINKPQFDFGASSMRPPQPTSTRAQPTQASPAQPASKGYVAGLGGGAGAKPQVLSWQPIIEEAARMYDVPADVIAAIMDIESGGDAQARSPQSAAGLMQVMPFHFKPGENAYDPRTNIFKGAQILSDNYKRFGNDWGNAALAYFTGGLNYDARDATGTSGRDYIRKFQDANSRYRGGPAQASAGSGGINTILTKAAPFLGKPYVWGGKDPSSGFDCSGLVGYLLTGQGESTVSLYGKSQPLSSTAAQPGDLVFYNMGQGDMRLQHVGIYLGNGEILQSGGTSQTVNISKTSQRIGSAPEFRRLIA